MNEDFGKDFREEFFEEAHFKCKKCKRLFPMKVRKEVYTGRIGEEDVSDYVCEECFKHLQL
jgi:hypothetical protein